MKLSIIIPVYRAEDTLERCIGSILHQSFTSYELILVDDGSPDACPLLCDEYAGKDSRIHVIHKENGGLSDARNVGIKRAKGLYITFIDSDDTIGENSLQQLMEELYQHPDVDILEYPIMERIGHPHREKLLSFSPKTIRMPSNTGWRKRAIIIRMPATRYSGVAVSEHRISERKKLRGCVDDSETDRADGDGDYSG